MIELGLKKSEGVYIIELEGELDLYSARKLKALYGKMVERDVKSIVINFEKLYYLDSSGLGSLLYMHQDAKSRKIKLSFCNVHGSPKKIIELTKLEKFFQIAGTLEESVALLKS